MIENYYQHDKTISPLSVALDKIYIIKLVTQYVNIGIVFLTP